MLLKPNLGIYRILKFTWKVDLIMITLCAITYYVDIYVTPDMHIPSLVTTLMGTAMAFFIAFNNNQAYSRWWEARIIWGGIVNDSRSWARNLLAYLSKNDNELQHLPRKMVLRHIAFLYALKSNLHRIDSDEYQKYLSEEDIRLVKNFTNVPNAILDLQAYDIQKLSDQQSIDGFRFIEINTLLKNFCDGMGKSERINNTVFPTNYIYFTKLFVWLLVVFVTATSAESVGPWAIILGWVLGFVFHVSHINGMSIMNPFEPKPACIPLKSITRTIEINLLEMLGEENIPAPVESMHDGEYIL